MGDEEIQPGIGVRAAWFDKLDCKAQYGDVGDKRLRGTGRLQREAAMSKRSLAVLAAAACLCAAKPAAPYPNDQTNFLLVRDGTRFEERRDLFRNRRPHASFEGAFAFVDESWSYGRKTEFKATHEFDLEKSGIRFPTRTAFQVGYFREYDPGGRTRNGRPLRFTVPKATAEIRYRDYRFFTVEVETKIKSSARPSETEGR